MLLAVTTSSHPRDALETNGHSASSFCKQLIHFVPCLIQPNGKFDRTISFVMV